MTVAESVKSAVGLAEPSGTIARPLDNLEILEHRANPSDTGSRQQMSEARLPMPYRDSCAHLLIPLNRCRQAEYYLPWKCEVRSPETMSSVPTWI